MTKPLDAVLDYHQRTKHHFQRYAAGPHGLDWASQPDPFRTYGGSQRLELPLLGDLPDPLYEVLYKPRLIAPQPLNLSNLAAVLELSFGISAWEQHENTRWALRCNPSSGNLHPTEAYVVSAGCSGLGDGVHHYVSRDHVLEQRCQFMRGESLLPPCSFMIGLSSIHWREAWKYGERAFRYCQHDVGHAIAAVRYAAAIFGWEVQLLADWSDADIATLLGTEREADFKQAEREHPDVLLLVNTGQYGSEKTPDPEALLNAARTGIWQGQANALSAQHVHDWPIIEDVARACAKPHSRETAWLAPDLPAPIDGNRQQGAVEIIRQRRSAQSFDGLTSITAARFYRMLNMTLPRANSVPWDTIQWQPRLHLLLFVHRVEGLEPGLYLFLRNPAGEALARAEFTTEFEWTPVGDCPAHFRLFRLASGDAKSAARALSCHQDIAADSAFSLGMLAEYESALTDGPWVYRRLFWEAGMIGQVLYLEAEAAGMRGTGIGCFFDDGVHDLLGIEGQALQSLYHFTVGGSLADTRLQTLPPYEHLKRA